VGIEGLHVPAAANGAERQTVQGKVRLDRPAPLPVNIVISSDSPNAAVGAAFGNGSRRSVTIDRGKTEGTFDIKTKPDGIPAGGSTTANITAIYGDPKIEQMVVTGAP
jgi:hypothetical protein